LELTLQIIRARVREIERERESLVETSRMLLLSRILDEFDARAICALFPFRALPAGSGNTFMACIN